MKVSKSAIVNIFTVLCAFLTIFQGLIPTLPVSGPEAITIISAITMYAITSLTAWKQALSKEINNKALRATFVAAIVVTIGGLNDLFPVFHFPEVVSQWLRFAVTFVIMGINMLSKVLYPTGETRSLI